MPLMMVSCLGSASLRHRDHDVPLRSRTAPFPCPIRGASCGDHNRDRRCSLESYRVVRSSLCVSGRSCTPRNWRRTGAGRRMAVTPSRSIRCRRMRVVEFTKITSVEALGHYRLRLGFSDGISRDVDLAGELRGPVFEALADPEFFAQVRVDDELGTVVWPNGADSTRSSCTATSSPPHASCITRAAQTRLAALAGVPRRHSVSRGRWQQQVALLRWIADGCSDGEMEGTRIGSRLRPCGVVGWSRPRAGALHGRLS